MSTFLSNLRHQLVEESSVIIPGSYVDQQSVVFSTYSQTVGQQTQNVIVDLSNNYINRNIYTTDTPHTIWYLSRHETRSYITNVNHLLNTSHLNNDDFYPHYQKREIPLSLSLSEKSEIFQNSQLLQQQQQQQQLQQLQQQQQQK